MATRSTISVVHEDGSVESVYCHWDGYPSHNGKLLLKNYNSSEKAKELVSYGDISGLKETIEKTEFFCRDNGESFHSDLFGSYQVFSDELSFQQFNYLYRNGKWQIDAVDEEIKRKKFIDFTLDDCEEPEE